jgi:MarR family 2-MHQ and catechol resistance regulon transcriptional repressor
MNRVSRDHSGAAANVAPEINEEQAEAEHVLHATALLYAQELPGADTDAIEAMLALLRSLRVHRTAVARQLEAERLNVGMSAARFTLLMTLHFSRDELLAQNEISRKLNVSRTNVTNLIDGLERDGLVVRLPNPTDRRVSYAQLTQAGHDLCLHLMPMITRLMEDATSDFTRDEKAQFKDFLYRVQRNIVAAYPGHYARGLGVDQE